MSALGVDGARPADLVFDPTIACRGVRSFSATTALLPSYAASDGEDEAGLTSKPHRDRLPGRSDAPPGRALRGPLRLRLASACRRDAPDRGVSTTQPRTRTDSMNRR